MAYKISTTYKEQVSGKLFTRVQITEDAPLTIISCLLEGDCTSLSEQELIHLALEDFYQRTYLNRAENEAITQLNKEKEALEVKLSEATKIIDNHKRGMYELLSMIGAIAEHVGYEFEDEEGVEHEGSQEDVSDGGSPVEGGE